jgi:hypothetical protein
MHMKLRGSLIGLLAAVALACFTLTGALAQTGTPAVEPVASPAASPEAAVACAALMNLGSPEDGCIIFIQASPDAGDLDLYIDGLKAVDALTFADVSGYFSLPSGMHSFDFVPAGGSLDDAILSALDVNIMPGTAYELATVGEGGDLELLVSPVDLSPLPPGEGTPLQNTRVRAIHAVASAPAVDVSIIGDDIAEKIFEDVTFPLVTDYVVKPAGAYRIQVAVSGMDFATIDLDRIDFQGDTVYSMYAIGSIDTGELRALEVSVDLDTGESTLRAVPPVVAAEVVQVSSFAVYSGDCSEPSGEVSLELSGSGYNGAGAGALAPWGGGGEPAGALAAVPVQYGEGTLDDLNLGQLLGGRTNSVVVRAEDTGEVIACGEIGGVVQQADNFWQHDRLIIGLREVNDSGVSGTATFTEDTGILEDKINVSVALTGSNDETPDLED